METPTAVMADKSSHVDSDMQVDKPEEAGTTPRLVITRMELENFKSYAGVQQIGIFHKCFSAVVGPNGSGKSNVIDAMLFVFGKRAKQLRLHKVSELIHNSSAVVDNPPNFARVSVYFEEIYDTGMGDDDFVVVPNSGIEVSRIAYKNNTSTYKINNKNCQFRDVAQYLGSKGIDLDNNRFLILQGEVEMISMMPPKGKNEGDDGLLEYLEDIIGSNQFVEATKEAEAKVEVLTDQRQERLNRVKAVQKEKDSLEAAKLEAQSLLQKERDIRRKKNILYQIYAMEATNEFDKIDSRSKEVKEQLDAERETMSQATQRVKEIEDGLSEKRSEYDKVHTELKDTKEQFTAYERRDIKLREEIKHLITQEKKLSAKIVTDEKRMTDAERKKEDAVASIPILEERLAELGEEKIEEDGKLEAIFEDIKGIANSLRDDLQKKTEELAPVQQELSAYESTIETSQAQIVMLENSAKRAREKLAAAEQDIQSIDTRKADVIAQVEEYENELLTGQQRITELDHEDEACAQKEAELNRKRNQVTTYIEKVKSAARNQGTVRSSAVRGLLKAARKGGQLSNAGILGRLGDLATIPAEFDVAVSTACGMLDHVVVQTTAGAQRCLEYLRKNNLGRANFVPLDKMKKGAHDRVVETPEGAPRLFDLISPSNFAIVPAIFLSVGDTLVAPDLETATRWAYEYKKRWRVVTIDGKLIETAGTMSGGGKGVRKGGMRIANSDDTDVVMADSDESMDKIKRCEAELANIDEQMHQIRDQRRNINDERRNLTKRMKVLESQIPKLKLEVDTFDATRQAQIDSIPELRSQCELSASDTKKLEELKDSVVKCKNDMQACADLASELSAEVTKIQTAILEAGGTKLKKQQKRCDDLQHELDETDSALRSARVAISFNEKAFDKAEKSKEACESDIVTAQESLAAKKEELISMEDDALEVMKLYESAKEIEAQKRNELEKLTKECEELQKEFADLKCVEIELAGKLDDLKALKKSIANKKEHWLEELSRLQSAANEEESELSDDEESDTEDEPQDDDENDVAAAKDEGIDDSMDEDTSKEPGMDQEDKPSNKVKKEHTSKSSLPTYTPDSLLRYDKQEVKEDITVLESERKSIAKNANMGAIAEYRRKEADYLARVEELDAVTDERSAVRQIHENLRRQRLEMFMDAFSVITLKLKEMYQMITQGGDAELELVDSLDPFSEGIVFSVRPPKKSWKNISNLSGGEKTLSSLALVFALHHFKPTPLYVMDEIDAALDFKNVSIVANYIKDRTKDAQFIIISLRNNMFELADRLIGIYKTNNCTKSVTINPRAFAVDCQQNGRVPSTPALRERSNVVRPLAGTQQLGNKSSGAVAGPITTIGEENQVM